jgi:hypothetical protein
MEPFQISDYSKVITGLYPDADKVKNALTIMDREERVRFLRLWVSEGIPFAFKEAPMLYEAIRGWLAVQLNVHPKVVTMVGSARIGYSLAPPPSYGLPFGSNSDLDFVVVSDKLFHDLSVEFFKWKSDVNNGYVQPRSDTEQKYWEDNLGRLPLNITRGFVDAKMIPYWYQYAVAQKIGDIMSKLINKLKTTHHAPITNKASIRVYLDWNAFIDQLNRSIWRTVRTL